MKTTLFALLIIGATNFIYAQNEIAFMKVDTEIPEINSSKEKNIMLNESYYLSIQGNLVPQRVKEFQRVVAAYDIKEADVYSENWKSTYSIVFAEGQNVITAEYDQSGHIIKSNESYEEVSLPYILSKKVTKEYPGWGFERVNCTIDYSFEQQPEIKYTVVIKNGTKKKTISIDASDLM